MSARRRALLVNVAHGAPGLGSDHPRHHVAPMDLGLAAAILERDGWQVDLWDTQTRPGTSAAAIERLAAAKAPDLLLLRPIHQTVSVAAALARRLAPKTPVRLGIGPAVQPEISGLVAKGALTGAFVGEPEETLLDALPAFRDGAVPEGVAGLATTAKTVVAARSFLRDLDALPLPAHRLFMRQGYSFRYPLDVRGPLRIGYSLSSRGCALGCVFCAPIERETYGTKYRWRSADNVCDELELLRELGANAVYFIDDFFGFSNKRLETLCETMLSRGVVMPWAAQVRAQGLPLSLLKLMRQAGCSTLCYGAESGSDRVLKLLRKGVSTTQVREQSALIREAGIQQVAYFIVGVPGETDDERAATYRLIEEIQPDVVQLHIFNVFEGAPAFEDDRFKGFYDPAATKFTGPQGTRNADLAQLDAERRAFYRKYYFDPRYLQRQVRRRFWPLMANLGAELEFAKRSARFFLQGGGTS